MSDNLKNGWTLSKIILILWTVVANTICFLFVIQPVIPKIIDNLLRNGTEPGKFPAPVDYLFINSQKYYFYIVLHLGVGIFMAFQIVIAHDTLFITYIHHGCGLYAVLGYAELVKATYSWCLFFMLGFNIFLITITGLQIVMRSIGPGETLKLVLSNMTAIAHLYIECYNAHILMTHSTSIRNYIYDSEWYRLPLKAQKVLLFMNVRCNTPCEITAGNLVAISVRTFTGVLKISMSYFNFLRSA